MNTKEPITRDTSLFDFKRLIAENNDEAWNIVNSILSGYTIEVTNALIELNIRGEQIVKAYIDRGCSLDNLVYWIMSKHENKNI